MTPQWATSKTSTVTVSGTLTNHTGSTLRGARVQLQWYPLTFLTRSNMESFANGGSVSLQGSPATLQTVGVTSLDSALANGAGTHWSVSFNISQAFLSAGLDQAIGDYPLQVVAGSATSKYSATSRTFLPYWPGTNAATPLKVAWIWPLIDTPQQGVCPQTLATNSLAGAFAANGRLSTLLDVGLQNATTDDLTWAVDPALLSDATVMTHTYFTGGNSGCTDRNKQAASPAAQSWLSGLSGTGGQPAFLTPYADVDAAALTHAGLDADLTSAYQLGDQVASTILPSTFGSDAGGTSLAVAWPTGGVADADTLTSLARSGGVSTVVLNSGELPTDTPPYDNALARTKTSTGASMTALLADSEITSILGSATASSSAGAQFAAVQDYLAQTAMIVAEGPSAPSRSLVVAPPTGWDPSPTEAADLLKLTGGAHKAPWLQVADLSNLAAAAAKLPAERLTDHRVSGAELSNAEGYIDQLRTLGQNVTQFESILSDPPKSYLSMLAAALAATQSSAWRGRGSPGGWLAATELSSYISDLHNTVKLIPVRKILLAGTTGDTLVSVQNGLNQFFLPQHGLQIAVRVGATAELGSSLSVTSPTTALVVVNPGMTQSVKLVLHSTTIGTTTLQLQLLARDGSPLTWAGASEPLSVEVTRFGRLILVIIFGALGVLVLATVVRLRRKRRRGGGRRTGGEHAADDKVDSRAHAGGAG